MQSSLNLLFILSDAFYCLFLCQDQFDTIDLTDNEIVKVENFPHMSRLGTLLMNNNRVTRINANIGGESMWILEVPYLSEFPSL